MTTHASTAERPRWYGVLALYGLLVLSLFGSASALRDRFSRLVVSGVDDQHLSVVAE